MSRSFASDVKARLAGYGMEIQEKIRTIACRNHCASLNIDATKNTPEMNMRKQASNPKPCSLATSRANKAQNAAAAKVNQDGILGVAKAEKKGFGRFNPKRPDKTL
jgi:hypothetical protein